jgi:excisionase family DNA binding protein
MTPGAPPAEVGDVTRLSARTLRRMSDDGTLPTLIGPAGELRVRLRDVRDLLARMSPDGPSAADIFPKLYTVPQAAELLGVSCKTVRRLIDAGELAAFQLKRSGGGRRGTSIRIGEDELRRFLERAAL